MISSQETKVALRGISKKFPGVQALDNVDFDLMPSEIHGLLGENGAGKSVMLKTLLGAFQRDQGEIFVEGKKIEILTPYIARELGLSAVYQELMLVKHLTVAENICLGWQPNKFGIVSKKEMRQEAQKILDRFNIKVSIDKKVDDLIIAHQQLVAIAKALAVNAKVLILDEPTAMLTDEETAMLFNAMRILKQEGVSIIYVSHRLEEIFDICDSVTILRDGKNVGHFLVSEITREEMIKIMSGREITHLYGVDESSDKRRTNEPILSVEKLTKEKKFRDISFTINKGEIVGFFGLVGSGRTDIMQAVFGASRYDDGIVILDGKDITGVQVKDTIKAGLALVPEERMAHGVSVRLSVKANINLADYPKVTSAGIVSSGKEETIAKKFIDLFQIKTPSSKQLVRNLSGGNQQKVSIAKWFNIEPKVIIFDEPTMGIDVGAKLEIYGLIRLFAKQGGGVIMISSYLPEIMGVCDRIIVLNNGRITGKLERKEATDEKVLSLAFKED